MPRLNQKTTAKGMRMVAKDLLSDEIVSMLYERDQKVVTQAETIRKKNREITIALVVGAVMLVASVIISIAAVIAAKPAL